MYYPIRLLGIIAGLFLVYGTSVAIVQRLRKKTKYYAHTTLSDWTFLGMLWLIGVTGFVLTLGEYVTFRGTWVDVVFLLHVGLAMELIVLLPFTKLAHVIYRPIALWMAEFRRLRADRRLNPALVEPTSEETVRRASWQRQNRQGRDHRHAWTG